MQSLHIMLPRDGVLTVDQREQVAEPGSSKKGLRRRQLCECQNLIIVDVCSRRQLQKPFVEPDGAMHVVDERLMCEGP